MRFLLWIAMRNGAFFQHQSSLLRMSFNLRTFLSRSTKAPDFFILNFTALDLFFQIHRDVAEATDLARQAPLINKVIGSNQTHFGFGWRDDIVIAFDDANAALSTAGYPFADGFDFNSIFRAKLEQGFVRIAFDFLMGGDEFDFHVTTTLTNFFLPALMTIERPGFKSSFNCSLSILVPSISTARP